MGSTCQAQHKNLLFESSLVLTFSSPKNNLWKVEFKSSVLYDHVLCIIEIMKNDCYVLVLQTINIKIVCNDVDCTEIIS